MPVLTKHTTNLNEYFLANPCHATSQSGVIELSLSDQELLYCPQKTTNPKLHKHKEIKVRSLKITQQSNSWKSSKGLTCANIAYQDLLTKFADAVGSL